MTSNEHWRKVWSVYHQVLEQPPERWATCLDEGIVEASVRDEVEELIRCKHEVGDFLEEPEHLCAVSLQAVEGDVIGAEEEHDVPDPLVGRHIGRYLVVRRVGRGGMGLVYEAEQDRPKQAVALKLIRGDLTSRRALRRFTEEAEILARLKHSYIARVHDSGVFDDGAGGRPYIVMEYVAGVPITEYMAEHDLDTPSRLELMARVCDAVQHAHQRGVIHRDLKPGNVLVEEVDGEPQPKVVDFGVARAMDVEAAASMLTERSEIVGTLPYMSPEQLSGDRDIDALSDVYALGILIFEGLTGRLPYDYGAGSMLETVGAIRDQRPRRLSAEHRKWRGDLETIVQKSIAKEPVRRYQSASELAEDIRRFLNCEPIVARVPSRYYEFQTFARRNPRLVFVGLLGLAALLAGSTISTWQAVRATHAEREATERFNDVRSLSTKMIFDVEPAIADLPGATPARMLLVDAGLEYLQRLERSAGDDVRVLRELGLAYERLGNIQGNTLFSNLGDYKGAHRTYERALLIWNRLLEHDPTNFEYLLARARARLWYDSTSPTMASLANPVDRPEGRRRVAEFRSLRSIRDTPEVRLNLAAALQRSGLNSYVCRNYSAAEQQLNECCDLFRERFLDEPGEPGHALQYGRSLHYYALVLTSAGRLEEADHCVQESLAVLNTARVRHALHSGLLYETIIATMQKARVLMAMDYPSESLTVGKNAIVLAEQLRQLGGDLNQRSFRLYGVVHCTYGVLLCEAADDLSRSVHDRQRHLEQALQAFEVSLRRNLERKQRGWLNEWESHYIAADRERIDSCRSALSGLHERHNDLEVQREGDPR